MIDSDNVLLLRPAVDAAMPIDAWRRAGAARDRVVLAIVAVPGQDFSASIAGAGGELVARYETEPSVNTFPRLPVREGESVAVWLVRCANENECTRLAGALVQTPTAPKQLLRLAPTSGSRF